MKTKEEIFEFARKVISVFKLADFTLEEAEECLQWLIESCKGAQEKRKE